MGSLARATALATLACAGVACGLNPQPLPPDTFEDAGLATNPSTGHDAGLGSPSGTGGFGGRGQGDGGTHTAYPSTGADGGQSANSSSGLENDNPGHDGGTRDGALVSPSDAASDAAADAPEDASVSDARIEASRTADARPRTDGAADGGNAPEGE